MKQAIFPLFLALSPVLAHAEPIEFNRDVRPILSENCFHCHGQDPKNREADLRLDTPEGLHGKNEAGEVAVVPGEPKKSLLWQRTTTTDPDDLMPPPNSHRELSEAQIATLRKWIEAGAPFEKHWAFSAPQKRPLPESTHRTHQPWDTWIHQKLSSQKLAPSQAASPATWLRRASFDLTGLAPTPEDVATFEQSVAEQGDAAYEQAVDRLLASPRFGEHRAAAWLDVARYADTHGFNNDSARSMWRWRDWVIDAFNRNLPYDQFIIQQLAGDLLPEATLENRLATGFNRNHVINSEGGIIDEEYRVEYVADRVRTVGTAWLGLTMECARCHDHKYDNISQADYYSLFAFFNQVPEYGEAGRLRNAAPLMRAPTRGQQEEFQRLTDELAKAETAIPAAQPSTAFIAPPKPAGDTRVDLLDRKDFSSAEDGRETTEWRPGAKKPFTFSTWLRWNGSEGVLFSSINYNGEPSAQGYGRGLELRVLADGRLELRASERWPGYANQLRSLTKLQKNRWVAVSLINKGGDNRHQGHRLFLDFQELELELLMDGLSGTGNGGKAVLGHTQGGANAPLQGSLAATAAWPTALDRDALAHHLESTLTPEAPWSKERDDLTESRQAFKESESYRQAVQNAQRLRGERLALQRSFPTTMVMADLPQARPTHVLNRGIYDALGEPVEPDVMGELLLSWPKDAPRNRLGLAQWLADPEHPLTARVVVNRFWQELFGTGLVKTADDFGVQGEYPSHPELLDWLSRDFIENGWDVKRLMKSLVLSATYRQSSRQDEQLRELDPENRLLARGPRVRLPAEAIRDHALHCGGLLVEHVGGPSVRPFQPEGFYKGMVVGADYPSTTWEDGTGNDLFRRSLYTFWKRTVPHPVPTVLDMPDREFCVATRSRTNTPLQALALMNEKGLLYAAAGLGRRMLVHSDTPSEALAFGFQLTTGRPPDETESTILIRAFEQTRNDWQGDPEAAQALLAECGVSDPADVVAEATFAYLGSMLLNLDETITNH